MLDQKFLMSQCDKTLGEQIPPAIIVHQLQGKLTLRNTTDMAQVPSNEKIGNSRMSVCTGNYFGNFKEIQYFRRKSRVVSRS